MRSIKVLLFSAAFGFVLSFVFGLFSHSAILIVLFKAFISALVFAALGFLVSFLSSKYLFSDSSEFEGDISNQNQEQPVLGSRVDYVIQEEELSSDTIENSYDVHDSKQMLNQTDILKNEKSSINNGSSSNGESTPQNGSNGDLPNIKRSQKINPAENIPDDEQSVSVSQNNVVIENSNAASSSFIPSVIPEVAATSSSIQNNNSSNDELDTLPDMNGFAIENNNNTEEVENDDVDSGTSEFATTVVSNSSNNSAAADVKDAAVMAKAISSILSGENE